MHLCPGPESPLASSRDGGRRRECGTADQRYGASVLGLTPRNTGPTWRTAVVNTGCVCYTVRERPRQAEERFTPLTPKSAGHFRRIYRQR
ncbi:MAG: hypothetical protein WC455_23300 [Dehalococcoidia bacterium]|jgi:hypothetical protein